MLWLGSVFRFCVALFLLPLLAGEIWTAVDLARRSIPAGEWRSVWFLSFTLGFGAWLIVFACLPRALWLYVLGHEFTHAIAALLAGGRVSAFHVSSRGGHIMTNRVNWWIALSPYFVPIYGLIWAALWLTVNFYYPLTRWLPALYFGLGLGWSFHLSFTVTMLHRRQTDLSGEGFFFSGVIIGLMNLLALLVLLALLNRDPLDAVDLLGSRTFPHLPLGRHGGDRWCRPAGRLDARGAETGRSPLIYFDFTSIRSYAAALCPDSCSNWPFPLACMCLPGCATTESKTPAGMASTVETRPGAIDGQDVDGRGVALNGKGHYTLVMYTNPDLEDESRQVVLALDKYRSNPNLTFVRVVDLRGGVPPPMRGIIRNQIEKESRHESVRLQKAGIAYDPAKAPIIADFSGSTLGALGWTSTYGEVHLIVYNRKGEEIKRESVSDAHQVSALAATLL